MSPPEPMHRSLPILLVGASTRSAAQSLARAQARCVTIDRFCDQDTLRASEASHPVETNQELALRLKNYPGHSVACVGQWPGMIDTIQQADARLMISAAAWRSASSIEQLKIAARQAGIEIPSTTPTRPIGKSESRILQKQFIHSGGLGIRWSKQQSSSCNGDFVYQEWIPGRSYGATFLASDSGVQLLGICRNLFRRIADLPFVYQGSFGPVNTIKKECRKKLWTAAESIASESGLRGIFSIDFVQSKQGKLSLLEVNPRWSASSEIIERSLTDTQVIAPAQSLMKISLDAMLSHRVPTLKPVSDHDRTWIKRIIYAKQPVRFDQQHAIDAAKEIGTLHDIPGDGKQIDSRNPICTLIAKTEPGKKDWWEKYRNAIGSIRGLKRFAE